MPKFKAIITDYITDELEPEKTHLGDLADLVALDAHSDEELRARVTDADVLMVYHNTTISAETIRGLRHCRLIIRCGVGFDNVDIRVAREHQIPVANVPDYGTEEVADSAVGMALSLARGIHQANSLLRQAPARWDYRIVAPLPRLRGRIFGIVGLGRIGTAAARRAAALGMDVIYYDPYKQDGYDKANGIRRVDRLDELLAQSYIVSLHCPATDETRGMIDAAAIAAMPRGSILINTARGVILDTAALPDALASGHLRGAGVDVLPCEPPATNDPLTAAWRDPQHPAHHRLLINPHSAFYCEEGLLEIRVKAATNCRNALTSQPIRNIINGV